MKEEGKRERSERREERAEEWRHARARSHCDQGCYVLIVTLTLNPYLIIFIVVWLLHPMFYVQFGRNIEAIVCKQVGQLSARPSVHVRPSARVFLIRPAVIGVANRKDRTKASVQIIFTMQAAPPTFPVSLHQLSELCNADRLLAGWKTNPRGNLLISKCV